MALEEKIMQDFKEAMKSKDALKVSTLSFLRSQFKYRGIELKAEKIDDGEVIAIIKKQLKQRLDSIEKFRQGNRPELAEKEEKEVVILKTYLPEELSQDALSKIVDEAIASVGASGMKDMGKVMKEVVAKAAGKADNKMISDTVKARLSSASA